MEILDHSIPDFSRNSEENRSVIAAISDGLTAYNKSMENDPSEAPLTLSCQTEEGDVVAGILGSNGYGWMRIDLLWVDDAFRRQGLGTALIERAEQIATERGCHGLHLDTHSFQAPGFYEKLGYEVFGRLSNYPGEEERIYYRKYLTNNSEP